MMRPKRNKVAVFFDYDGTLVEGSSYARMAEMLGVQLDESGWGDWETEEDYNKIDEEDFRRMLEGGYTDRKGRKLARKAAGNQGVLELPKRVVEKVKAMGADVGVISLGFGVLVDYEVKKMGIPRKNVYVSRLTSKRSIEDQKGNWLTPHAKERIMNELRSRGVYGVLLFVGDGGSDAYAMRASDGYVVLGKKVEEVFEKLGGPPEGVPYCECRDLQDFHDRFDEVMGYLLKTVFSGEV